MLPEVNTEDYRYELPEERIAQYPEAERDRSKLLLFRNGIITEDIFKNVPQYIPRDSLLVFNNTKVIRARFLFTKKTGALVEVFCLEPLAPAEYERAFSSVNPVEWKCIIGNLKKWKEGKLSTSIIRKNKKIVIEAEKIRPEGEAWRIRFSWNDNMLTFGEICESAGHIPLPPYIKRDDTEEDNIRYQTVYSEVSGSVAAPTAGLHFTKDVLDALDIRGIASASLTLHIGAGTFKPVKTSDISKHEMHCEHFLVTAGLIRKILRFRGKIIAVGTTSVRTLESLYWLGARSASERGIGNDLHVDQWEPYENDSSVTFEQAFEALNDLIEINKQPILYGSTTLMIVPGYRFRVINGMITNFHQPSSTLLMLVSAYTGMAWKDIYDYALSHDFRFLSFGDSSLLLNSF